jgi:hypothetical protein
MHIHTTSAELGRKNQNFAEGKIGILSQWKQQMTKKAEPKLLLLGLWLNL